MTRGAKRYLPEKVTSKQLGEAVGRKPSTIGNWVSEGLLAPLDHDGPVGSPRYDLLDGLLAAHTKGIDLTQLVTRIPPTLVPRWNALADESALTARTLPTLPTLRALQTTSSRPRRCC
jgi:hypothetical protein